MKRAVVALALIAAACSPGGDRYLPKYGKATMVVGTNGPVLFTLAPSGEIVFVELRTLELYTVVAGRAPTHLVQLTVKPDSLSVSRSGSIWAAGRDKLHRLRIWYAADLNEPELRAKGVQGKFNPGITGPASRFPVHFALTDAATFVVGFSQNLFTIRGGSSYGQREVISSGWTDPVFTFGRGKRIWVADNALPGSKERVARGRERSVAKRNRFASVLPPYTNPSGMALVGDELLLCSKTHKKVYRLHIGLDEVARRRGWMAGLVCDRDIVADARGGLYTATNGAIYHYVQR